jgi:hypothetical protein
MIGVSVAPYTGLINGIITIILLALILLYINSRNVTDTRKKLIYSYYCKFEVINTQTL